jgi:DNA-directed RNA polymerase subunit RPC12/RpoP
VSGARTSLASGIFGREVNYRGNVQWVGLGATRKDGMINLVVGLLLFAFLLAIYFLPALVASGRRHYNRGAILVLNLFLGWTLIGWVAALVWACMNPGTATAPLSTEDRVPCPHCGGRIITTARVCRFCGRELAADWSRPLLLHQRA